MTAKQVVLVSALVVKAQEDALPLGIAEERTGAHLSARRSDITAIGPAPPEPIDTISMGLSTLTPSKVPVLQKPGEPLGNLAAVRVSGMPLKVDL